MFNRILMNRHQTAKAETRLLILNATKKILLENPATYTMRQVAKKAGVSPASVVVHFKNKTGLLEAALYEDIEKTILEAIITMPENRPFLDRLMHIWQKMFYFYSDNKELYRELLRSTTFEPANESPRLKEQMDHFLDFVKLVVTDEQAQGTIDNSLDAMMVAESLGAFYFGMLIRFFNTPEMAPQEAVAYLKKLTNQYLQKLSP